ncbi:hydantoinase/oxoprolinase family protein [Variovorax sp. J22R133]|uniref:hydantoinase/oxoprolinase family protein n=1 Tax=Variovorax brevis TaxID=3053503 RepID=UPI0025773996|nr:hydantoinase/oxoprolinase family protein [Variovorax sp. J22R133]MDM0115985.1 hydantoinase/oxoprolinase family protein [Variovorax sp. J22R133]
MATIEERTVIGWDIGGAHVKACLLQGGEVHDVAQWACPLWLGMDRLEGALQAATQRWSGHLAQARHAVTMTGEMVDLFSDREDGVRQIAAALARSLEATSGARDSIRFFAGDADWCREATVPAFWHDIASANWLATARHAAQRFGNGLLVDIGSTTTDLIAFKDGRVATTSRADAQRLASGELVYHGVVRTPLCAVAQRIDWRGKPHNVMNEFFATSADVYRRTGELNPAHDLYPSADNAAKDAQHTRQRLARMIGLDLREGSPEDWDAFAHTWRAAQVAVLGGEMRRVMQAHRLPDDAVFVSAGCGDFLVKDVAEAAQAGKPALASHRHYGRDVANVAAQAHAGPAAVQDWAQVCAPCVAVAALLDMDA